MKVESEVCIKSVVVMRSWNRRYDDSSNYMGRRRNPWDDSGEAV
jgi:hypothetical protein